MPDVSAAIIVVAGAVLILVGSISSSLTDAARQRIMGYGSFISLVGIIAWVIGWFVVLNRIIK
jgi:hypothetical protein